MLIELHLHMSLNNLVSVLLVFQYYQQMLHSYFYQLIELNHDHRISIHLQNFQDHYPYDYHMRDSQSSLVYLVLMRIVVRYLLEINLAKLLLMMMLDS